MESQPQNLEFRINPENFHPCTLANNEEQDEMLGNVAFHHGLHSFLMDILTCCSFVCSLFLCSEHLGQLMRLEIFRQTSPEDKS